MKQIIILILLSINLSINAFTVSEHGKSQIKKFENLKLKVYDDGKGNKTIGYGHKLLKDEKFKSINLKQAEKLFNKDIKIAENSANNLIKDLKCTITQGMFDTIVSLVYNCGESGIRKSTFYDKLCRCRKNNKQDLEYARSFIKTTNVSMPGHKIRRLEEYKHSKI